MVHVSVVPQLGGNTLVTALVKTVSGLAMRNGLVGSLFRAGDKSEPAMVASPATTPRSRVSNCLEIPHCRVRWQFGEKIATS